MSKILLIEDDPVEARLYQHIFIRANYEVVVATSGKEGVEKAKSWRPDLIFLDLLMPNTSGFAILSMLKEKPDTRGIPVVVFSNLSDKKDIEMALAKGAIRHIVKLDTDETQLIEITKSILASLPKPAA